jgi:hypothetical protein
MWWSQRGHKWRHNMAHASFMLDKQGYMHARALTRTDKCVMFIVFLWQKWFANAPQCYVIHTLSVLLLSCRVCARNRNSLQCCRYVRTFRERIPTLPGAVVAYKTAPQHLKPTIVVNVHKHVMKCTHCLQYWRVNSLSFSSLWSLKTYRKLCQGVKCAAVFSLLSLLETFITVSKIQRITHSKQP